VLPGGGRWWNWAYGRSAVVLRSFCGRSAVKLPTHAVGCVGRQTYPHDVHVVEILGRRQAPRCAPREVAHSKTYLRGQAQVTTVPGGSRRVKTGVPLGARRARGKWCRHRNTVRFALFHDVHWAIHAHERSGTWRISPRKPRGISTYSPDEATGRRRHIGRRVSSLVLDESRTRDDCSSVRCSANRIKPCAN